MSRRGLTQRVRVAAGDLEQFTAKDIFGKLDIRTRADQQRIRSVIHDLKRTGEIISIERGLYKHIERLRARTKIDIIWHLVRSHRHFTTNDIERLSRASRHTILEYLNCLATIGYIRKTGWQSWRLVKDLGPKTPVNMEKCKRLRELRKSAARSSLRVTGSSLKNEEKTQKKHKPSSLFNEEPATSNEQQGFNQQREEER